MNLNEQSWQLLLGALRGTLDAHQQAQFDAWIGEDDNRLLYDDIARAWDEIRQQAAAYEPDREKLWAQLQQRIAHAEAPEVIEPTLESNTSKAPEVGNTVVIPMATAHETIEASIAPQPLRSVRPRNFWWRTAAAVAAAVVVTLFAARPDAFTPAPPAAEQQIVAFEGKSQARLADGTLVWLHGGSTLALDNRFDASNRTVRLTGEGFFEVTKDSKHPFTVEIGALTVTVHGTRFNVNSSHDGITTQVALVEGAVTLHTADGAERQIEPGQIARYNSLTEELTVQRGDVQMAACWAADRLTFKQQTLGEVCRYMARWYDTDIRISPSLEHNYAYTFTVTDEPLEEILRIMSRINPITYTFSADNVVSITETE